MITHVACVPRYFSEVWSKISITYLAPISWLAALATCRRIVNSLLWGSFLIKFSSLSASTNIEELAGHPGVARAFALRAEVCRFAPQAPLSLACLPITPSRGEHTPLWRKLLFDRSTCIIQLSLLEKVTRVIERHCVHYRQKKKSKEKRANCETST